MRYEKLLKNVDPKTYKTISRWYGLMLNERTGAIYPANKWRMQHAKKNKQPYNMHTANFYFMPGDICVINTMPFAMYDLMPYGMSGRIETRKSPKSKYIYVFELFDKYEAYEGMRVSMVDGKPLDARLLDDIPYDEGKMAKFKERYAEIAHTLNTLIRMAEDGHVYDHKWSAIEFIKKNEDTRLKLLAKAFNSSSGGWAKGLGPHVGAFKHLLHYNDDQNTADKPRKSANLRAFDNMVRFDKASLFLSLGIVQCRPSK